MLKTKEIIEKKLKEIPESCRKLTRKAIKGECSPRSAIKAFCYECIGYVRKELENCTSPLCPLFEYRPNFARKRPGGAVSK